METPDKRMQKLDCPVFFLPRPGDGLCDHSQVGEELGGDEAFSLFVHIGAGLAVLQTFRSALALPPSTHGLGFVLGEVGRR